jgi:hypothetical protein
LPIKPPELTDDIPRFDVEKINQIVARVATASFDCLPLVE